MKTLDLIKNTSAHLKHLAVALAICAGLGAGSANALPPTTTETFDLGTSPAGTQFADGGVGGLFVWISKGSLPVGSILRSVKAINVKLEANPGDNYTGDIGVVVDPSPATLGGSDNLLTINDENGAGAFGGTVHTDWAGQGYTYNPFSATVSAPSHFPAGIDLHDGAVLLGSSYGSGTYSGKITIEYDVTALLVKLRIPAEGQSYLAGTSITASAEAVDPNIALTATVTFHTTPVSPAGPTVDTVSTSTASPFTADLGTLAGGTYSIYATVTNNDSPQGNATSATHTFTVAAGTTTTTTLASSANPSTYGQCTLTSTVSPTPTGGTVQFYDNGSPLGSAVTVNTGTGMASLNVNSLDVGTHSITATYSGQSIYLGSASGTLSQVVDKAQLTVKALNTLRAPNTANPDPLPYQITGYQNGQSLATSGVSGTPTLTTTAVLSSPVGDYPITAALGSLAASNYSFTFVNGTLAVAVTANTFSVNFYSGGGSALTVPSGVPAGMSGWFASGWLNTNCPFGGGVQPAVTLSSNQGSTATFHFNNCRNGGAYDGARTTFLGDGNYNMMDGHANSTLNGPYYFDMQMTEVPFATYDVIFYLGGNHAQFGDGTGVIEFNGVQRAFTLKDQAFDGTFTEIVNATTPGNYIVFHNVTGTSFTTRTWGLGSAYWGAGLGDFNHVGPFGFQIKDTTPAASGYSAWQTANNTTQTIAQDLDGDGVSNGIEYFMFGPVASSGFTALPGVVNTSGVLSITWTKDGAYTGVYGTDFRVETSDSLSIWTTETLGGNVVISGNTAKYTFPAGPVKKFARLVVTGP